MNSLDSLGEVIWVQNEDMRRLKAQQMQMANAQSRNTVVTRVPPCQPPLPSTISGIDRAALPCGCRLGRHDMKRECQCGEWEMRELLVDYGDRFETRSRWRKKKG